LYSFSLPLGAEAFLLVLPYAPPFTPTHQQHPARWISTLVLYTWLACQAATGACTLRPWRHASQAWASLSRGLLQRRATEEYPTILGGRPILQSSSSGARRAHCSARTRAMISAGGQRTRRVTMPPHEFARPTCDALDKSWMGCIMRLEELMVCAGSVAETREHPDSFPRPVDSPQVRIARMDHP